MFALGARYSTSDIRCWVSIVSNIGMAFLFLAFAGAVVSAEEGNQEARVTEVIDGATIIVSYDGRSTSCLYIGVSAPESENPLAATGSEARQFNRELVEGKIVRLEFDEQKYDKYGRLLAYVYCDDVFVNAEVIRQGYGSVMIVSPNTRYAEKLLQLETQARKSKRGLWAEQNAMDSTAGSETSLEKQIAIIMERLAELSSKIDQLFEIMKELQSQARSASAAEHSPAQKLEQAPALQMKTGEQVDAGSTDSQPDQMVYVTTSGKKYHKLGCRFLMGNYKEITIEEAKRRGLTPCSFCFPRESK